MYSRVKKILNLRVFDGDDGKRWDKSVMDKQYEVLCVSQVSCNGNRGFGVFRVIWSIENMRKKEFWLCGFALYHKSGDEQFMEH